MVDTGCPRAGYRHIALHSPLRSRIKSSLSHPRTHYSHPLSNIHLLDMFFPTRPLWPSLTRQGVSFRFVSPVKSPVLSLRDPGQAIQRALVQQLEEIRGENLAFEQQAACTVSFD
jgi:hypothetical protein